MTPSERRDHLVARRGALVKCIVSRALAKHDGDARRGGEWCSHEARRFERAATRLRRNRRKRVDVGGDPGVLDLFRDLWLCAGDELLTAGSNR